MSGETSDGNLERFHNELGLMEAMYPDDISFDAKSQEVIFSPEDGKVVLRIPPGYPSIEQPVVISAAHGHSDLRDEISKQIRDLPVGEESLDAICLAFSHLVQTADGEKKKTTSVAENDTSTVNDTPITVIIWLHHLLSTTKRKAILDPPGSAVSGISKPGYPGVLIFTGLADRVHSHVRSLREMNWQAFQIRAELDEEWQFRHGTGMAEVETMGAVVDSIMEGSEGVEKKRKEVFLQAMKMK